LRLNWLTLTLYGQAKMYLDEVPSVRCPALKLLYLIRPEIKIFLKIGAKVLKSTFNASRNHLILPAVNEIFLTCLTKEFCDPTEVLSRCKNLE